jgi:hypothetical protein
MLDLMHIIAAFWFQHIHSCCCCCWELLSKTDEPTEVPHNVVAGMVKETICDHAVAQLSGKRLSSFFKNPIPRKKSKQIVYDREWPRWCVMDDWLGPIPRFSKKHLNTLSVSSLTWLALYSTILWSVIRSGGIPSAEPENLPFLCVWLFFVLRRCCAMECQPLHSLTTFKWVRQHQGQGDVYQN